jgi:hypothetical protein
MTSKCLVLIALAGCAIDADLDDSETESELQYCPDDECEPIPAPTPRPDLVALPGIDPCFMTYVNYPQPHYKIGFRITNKGTAAAGFNTASIQFIVGYMDYESTPLVLSFASIAPGQTVGASVKANTYCWNSTGGCQIKVKADAAGAYGESNESNNVVTWTCRKT